ncbi:WhiB family transcriptional regulator [Actinosynnema mirum]|uniref:Transcriptional regulator WhiB n=1 Tax=Actinosynnema mirum (strain ATCC 29888 / DSM 43827 / JCM 3225 / NBRC 14064 / NCIMB 13271 / NRRL B-12336 / IMRU 3971 / 101) TaxID=446462 RepID=C6WBA4_ACTMD|nr:WhiB family transcriptional regulator [Actinosynnema mirum]ACU39395.1 transcription factor WhiB [Actinosynnema mirum DSM 43827]
MIHQHTRSPLITPDPPSPTNWRRRAACRYSDPELFFPRGRNQHARHQTEAARAVCHTCPVVDQCREEALTMQRDDGVWGAMAADERRTLKQQRTQAAHRATRRP